MPEPTFLPGSVPNVKRRPPPTRDAIENAPLLQIGRATYPGGSGRLFEAAGLPRVTYIVWSHDDGDRTDASWLVDGTPVGDIDRAVEALAAAPTLSAIETEILELVPEAWTRPASFLPAVMGDRPTKEHAPRRRVLAELFRKGLIEVDGNAFRRVAVG